MNTFTQVRNDHIINYHVNSNFNDSQHWLSVEVIKDGKKILTDSDANPGFLISKAFCFTDDEEYRAWAEIAKFQAARSVLNVRLMVLAENRRFSYEAEINQVIKHLETVSGKTIH